MNIKGGKVLVAHSAGMHICLISQNQSRCYRIDRIGGAFVMIADGCNNSSNIFRICLHIIQNTKCHNSTALRMILPIDHIADIMQITGNTG